MGDLALKRAFANGEFKKFELEGIMTVSGFSGYLTQGVASFQSGKSVRVELVPHYPGRYSPNYCFGKRERHALLTGDLDKTIVAGKIAHKKVVESADRFLQDYAQRFKKIRKKAKIFKARDASSSWDKLLKCFPSTNVIGTLWTKKCIPMNDDETPVDYARRVMGDVVLEVAVDENNGKTYVALYPDASALEKSPPSFFVILSNRSPEKFMTEGYDNFGRKLVRPMDFTAFVHNYNEDTKRHYLPGRNNV